GRLDALDSEELECERRAHDVDDRVDAADLVEVDRVLRRAVDLRLRDREAVEDRAGALRGSSGEMPPVYDREDVREAALDGVRLGVELDVDARRGDRALVL